MFSLRTISVSSTTLVIKAEGI